MMMRKHLDRKIWVANGKLYHYYVVKGVCDGHRQVPSGKYRIEYGRIEPSYILGRLGRSRTLDPLKFDPTHYYKMFYYAGCTTQRYYYEVFQKGIVFFTTNELSVQTNRTPMIFIRTLLESGEDATKIERELESWHKQNIYRKDWGG
jgi:hypothetical protein